MGPRGTHNKYLKSDDFGKEKWGQHLHQQQQQQEIETEREHVFEKKRFECECSSFVPSVSFIKEQEKKTRVEAKVSLDGEAKGRIKGKSRRSGEISEVKRGTGGRAGDEAVKEEQELKREKAKRRRQPSLGF